MTEKQMVLDFVDAKIESLEDYLDNLRPEEESLRSAPEHDLIMFKKIKEILELTTKKNEWLEQILRIYRKVANCHNCDYLAYDWFDDGDEFEICEKGNNEQQMDYHICEDWREL